MALSQHPARRGLAKIALALGVSLPFAGPAAGCGAQTTGGAEHSSATNGAVASAPSGTQGRLRATRRNLSPGRLVEARTFKRADDAFRTFCKDWESKLRARERNNIAHIAWRLSRGVESGDYVGYGNVQSCMCKESTAGVPIGKLRYQEFEYHLEGKTLDEARHAAPKPAAITNTTEIFRWDKMRGKWIY